MSTGRPTALGLTEYLLLSNRTRQVFETETGTLYCLAVSLPRLPIR
jgi:hypothetical protein